MYTVDNALVEKWEPVLEGVKDDYTKRVTAQLLENQAKAIISEKMGDIDEAFETGSSPTSVGKLGTFQKFAFPLVRRVYPKLIANSIVGVQPMQGPVSQIFYIGNTRVGATASEDQKNQTVYSKFNMTYRGFQTSSIYGNNANLDLDAGAGKGGASHDMNAVLSDVSGSPSTTVGGQIAAWPDTTRIYGWTVSAGEALSTSAIPEINFHIEQQPVAARTRKMRALWTLEAQQDLKAYHNLDLERELTDLLGKELALEIDRELIEDLRMLAYDVNPSDGNFGGFNRRMLDNPNSNKFTGMDFGETNGTDFTYDFTAKNGTQSDPKGTLNNVFMIDFTSSALDFAPQHVGHVYANLLAVINISAQDIYKSTWRGPGSWLLCAPLIASLLESAAKLEGGIPTGGGPSNMGNTSIEYKGKFAGKYDLYVDPLYPEDEIMVGYKGANAMDAGYVYAPYIPMQQLPTITDPLTFQPRKGILTRYGKAVIQPVSRFYRIVRIVGPVANYLYTPFVNANNEAPAAGNVQAGGNYGTIA